MFIYQQPRDGLDDDLAHAVALNQRNSQGRMWNLQMQDVINDQAQNSNFSMLEQHTPDQIREQNQIFAQQMQNATNNQPYGKALGGESGLKKILDGFKDLTLGHDNKQSTSPFMEIGAIICGMFLKFVTKMDLKLHPKRKQEILNNYHNDQKILQQVADTPLGLKDYLEKQKETALQNQGQSSIPLINTEEADYQLAQNNQLSNNEEPEMADSPDFK